MSTWLEYIERRNRAIQSQLETIDAVMRSAENATDPDTIEGRRARLGRRPIRRMLETFAQLRVELDALEGEDEAGRKPEDEDDEGRS